MASAASQATEATKLQENSAVSASTGATQLPLLSTYQYVVLDIEGTTTSISFVADVLFPYARSELKNFLLQTRQQQQTQADIAALREQAQKDASSSDEKLRQAPQIPTEEEAGSFEVLVTAVVANVNWNMDMDRKMTALKQLQGHIWEQGYNSPEGIRGHVFDDVVPAFERWIEAGKLLFIYSSGSVAAQQHLFRNSIAGDLLPMISGHYDTVFPGSKVESSSYIKIATDICRREAEHAASSYHDDPDAAWQEVQQITPEWIASKILFLTDNVLEAKAAREAGWQVVLCDRPGNKPLQADDRASFPIVASFKEF